MKFKGCSEIRSRQPTIELQVNDTTIDLHNAAEFLSFMFVVNERRLVFNFKYFINYEEAKSTDCNISLLNISSFTVNPRDSEMPFSEDDCLSEIYVDEEKNLVRLKFWGGMSIEAVCEEFEFNGL